MRRVHYTLVVEVVVVVVFFFFWPYKFTKNALYLSANVFSTKVLLGDTFFYVVAPTEDETSILRGYPSHAKV